MRVAVFCGSKTGDSPLFMEAATAFGRALATHGHDLVYGGAAHGLMGAVAGAVLEGGRHVIGVVPRGWSTQERSRSSGTLDQPGSERSGELAKAERPETQEFAHPELSEHVLVDDLYQRKAMMAQKADAFVALPGGFGTLDELFDMLTAAQVGLHAKPIGLLDVDGYYAPLLGWITQALQRGFIPSGLKELLLVRSNPDDLVRALLTHQPPPSTVRWIRD
ncbi:MAG: TIGR00730 family Rossman fold protein [Archangium sp.]|nr:TIGR00730 family Rossman fold protein [Archangium sp.]